MPLFPVPAIVALAGWLYIVASSNPVHIAIGFIMAAIGATIYLLQARRMNEWPFRTHEKA